MKHSSVFFVSLLKVVTNNARTSPRIHGQILLNVISPSATNMLSQITVIQEANQKAVAMWLDVAMSAQAASSLCEDIADNSDT